MFLIYLSGIEENPEEEANKTDITFNLKDIENLEANFDRYKKSDADCVDLLITNQWPKYIEKQSNQQLVCCFYKKKEFLANFQLLNLFFFKENNLSSLKFGSELVSFLATRVKPRYHFSANQNIFFERIPYRNHKVLTEKERNLTRFLALANVNKSNKPKVFSKNINY